MSKPFPSAPPAKPPWRCPWFLAMAALTVAYYALYLAPTSLWRVELTWDAYRDIAAAQHLLAGGSPFADPNLAGLPAWYPPLRAAFAAGWIRLTGADVFAFHALLPSLLNWMFPLGFFLLARQLLEGDSQSAFWSALAAAMMPWAVTYVFASPVTMAHAAALGMPLLAIYAPIHPRAGWRPFAAWGAAAGMLYLFHPPTAAILLATASVHAVWEGMNAGGAKTGLARAGAMVSAAAAVGSVHWLPLMGQPVLNPEPMRYIAPGLRYWDLALPGGSWRLAAPVLLIAALGLRRAWRLRGRPGSRFVFALLAVSLAGQAPAYAVIAIETFAPEWESYTRFLPVFLPHEFQLYAQIALCLLAGFGMQQFRVWGRKDRRWIPAAGAALFLAAWTPAAIDFPARSRAFLQPHRLKGGWEGAVAFIRENTRVNDVICAPDDWTAFHIVGAQTGRKSISTYPSHMNPLADAAARRAARDRVFGGPLPESLYEARERHGLTHALFTSQSIPRARAEALESFMEPVYADGAVFVFRLPPAP